MKVLDLFSGIGGFSLGLERAGMETVAFCEIEPFCQKVLKKHWPNVPIHDDVRTLDGKQYRGTIDVVCGGFPCQDLSTAGKQAGFGGERSSLYREMLRVVSDCRPKYAVFENVTGLLSGERGRWFAQFLYDLAEVGYHAEWHCISASFLGAQHHRDRVWVIAYANSERPQRSDKESRETYFQDETSERRSAGGASPSGIAANADQWGEELSRAIGRVRREKQVKGDKYWEAASEPFVCRGTHGIPHRMDRIRALGNAVVPQIPEIIGRAIMSLEAGVAEVSA